MRQRLETRGWVHGALCKAAGGPTHPGSWLPQVGSRASLSCFIRGLNHLSRGVHFSLGLLGIIRANVHIRTVIDILSWWHSTRREISLQLSLPAKGSRAALGVPHREAGKVLEALSQQAKTKLPQAKRKQKKGKNNVIKQISHSALVVLRQACVFFHCSCKALGPAWEASVSVRLLAGLRFGVWAGIEELEATMAGSWQS